MTVKFKFKKLKVIFVKFKIKINIQNVVIVQEVQKIGVIVQELPNNNN